MLKKTESHSIINPLCWPQALFICRPIVENFGKPPESGIRYNMDAAAAAYF